MIDMPKKSKKDKMNKTPDRGIRINNILHRDACPPFNSLNFDTNSLLFSTYDTPLLTNIWT
jgi:hypothetical protein